jgi:hypothetical protein
MELSPDSPDHGRKKRGGKTPALVQGHKTDLPDRIAPIMPERVPPRMPTLDTVLVRQVTLTAQYLKLESERSPHI